MTTLQPHKAAGYLIGQAANLSGVSSANIRFYEKEMLIGRYVMGAGSYRMYSDEDVHQLRFIRQLRSLDTQQHRIWHRQANWRALGNTKRPEAFCSCWPLQQRQHGVRRI